MTRGDNDKRENDLVALDIWFNVIVKYVGCVAYGIVSLNAEWHLGFIMKTEQQIIIIIKKKLYERHIFINLCVHVCELEMNECQWQHRNITAQSVFLYVAFFGAGSFFLYSCYKVVEMHRVSVCPRIIITFIRTCQNV